MELKAIIYKIGQTQVITDNFRKREVILKTDIDTEYPQYITAQLVNNKVGIIDNFTIGREVTISFNLRGRLTTGPTGEEKAYTNIEIWKIN